jgi:hypothetical protein
MVEPMTTMNHEPDVVARECGGWLAVSKPDDELRIGVTADTEAEARERFDAEVEAWLRLLEQAKHG